MAVRTDRSAVTLKTQAPISKRCDGWRLVLGTWVLRAQRVWWPALALLLAGGCAPMDAFVGGGDVPPVGPVHQVVATWHNEVVFAPDPVHGGAQTPGLAGRLYLFGPEIKEPLAGGGSVVVDVFDDRGDKPVMLEEWRLDPDTLRQLQRKDMIGWGYTLFLPWGTYKPDIKQVHLRLCYQPAKGAPLYTESSRISLGGGSPVTSVATSKPVPTTPGIRPPTAAELVARTGTADTGGVQVSRFPLSR
jgi:hypothetical protein